MAVIERHPDVVDYIVEMSLADIRARGGVADLVEEGHIVIVKDFRLDFAFDALSRLSANVDAVADEAIRRKLKKLEARHFFEDDVPTKKSKESPGFGSTLLRALFGLTSGKVSLRFKSPLRQALFDVVCRGDVELYEHASADIRTAHDAALRVFETAFPHYDPYRLISSLRLTRTLFENLHWDNHSIDDDFHQARVFANLDARPRIWHVSHRFPDMMRDLYHQHNLSRFADRDPNELINYITGDLLGGTQKKWLDSLPRHKIAFDPGEMWLGESRLISHQIYYGEAAMVYMWFVRTASMANPENRFNRQVERIHSEMSELPS